MLEGPATRTGVAVDYYASEEALLRALAARVRRMDPDVLIGYEIQRSSWGYLVDRAVHAYRTDRATSARRACLQGSGRRDGLRGSCCLLPRAMHAHAEYHLAGELSRMAADSSGKDGFEGEQDDGYLPPSRGPHCRHPPWC